MMCLLIHVRIFKHTTLTFFWSWHKNVLKNIVHTFTQTDPEFYLPSRLLKECEGSLSELPVNTGVQLEDWRSVWILTRIWNNFRFAVLKAEAIAEQRKTRV